MSICLYIYLSVYPSVCLSTCLSIFGLSFSLTYRYNPIASANIKTDSVWGHAHWLNFLNILVIIGCCIHSRRKKRKANLPIPDVSHVNGTFQVVEENPYANVDDVKADISSRNEPEYHPSGISSRNEPEYHPSGISSQNEPEYHPSGISSQNEPEYHPSGIFCDKVKQGKANERPPSELIDFDLQLRALSFTNPCYARSRENSSTSINPYDKLGPPRVATRTFSNTRGATSFPVADNPCYETAFVPLKRKPHKQEQTDDNMSETQFKTEDHMWKPQFDDNMIS